MKNKIILQGLKKKSPPEKSIWQEIVCIVKLSQVLWEKPVTGWYKEWVALLLQPEEPPPRISVLINHPPPHTTPFFSNSKGGMIAPNMPQAVQFALVLSGASSFPSSALGRLYGENNWRTERYGRHLTLALPTFSCMGKALTLLCKCSGYVKIYVSLMLCYCVGKYLFGFSSI